MQAPIPLPEGWTIEHNPMAGTVITGFDTWGNQSHVTVCEVRRSFELGITVPQTPMGYKGREWRQQLYRAAVDALTESLESEDLADVEYQALLPARTGLLEVIDWYNASAQRKLAVYGYGAASESQKKAALKTLHRGGDALSSHLFLDKDCHELWVNSKLIGLCSLSTSVGHQSVASMLHTTLSGIFIHKQYRGYGLGSTFIQSLWTDLEACYTATISQAVSSGAKNIEVYLNADFETEEGAAVFGLLEAYLKAFVKNAQLAFKTEITLTVDAGF